MITQGPLHTLSAPEWRGRAENHRVRAESHTGAARHRRDRGSPHPIEDFLFTYYPFSIASIEKWHPGAGLALEWTPPHPKSKFPKPFTTRCYRYEDGLLISDPSKIVPKQIERLSRISALLEATRDRAPNFACHGLHEWAMVYRGRDIRHEKTLELRLPQSEVDALVESRQIRCTHHDAFRFFTPEARPMNQHQPTLETRELMEQPACLHANMDLYKWAAKAMPWIGSDLLLDCFELAKELRELDMRASPYDLTPWEKTPVRIETSDGRKEYEAEQKRLAERARPLRQRVIDGIGRVIEFTR